MSNEVPQFSASEETRHASPLEEDIEIVNRRNDDFDGITEIEQLRASLEERTRQLEEAKAMFDRHVAWEANASEASEIERLRAKAEAAEATLKATQEALRVIYATVRGDEHSECWTIRKWLDERGIFNDDIQGTKRLIEGVCVFAEAALTASPPLTYEERARILHNEHIPAAKEPQ